MTKVIKGGTIVTADRQYQADVLIEGETIKEIGPDLSAEEVIDAEGAYVIPGGIDPHTHLEMPFMGTTAAETFESGTWAAAAGGTGGSPMPRRRSRLRPATAEADIFPAAEGVPDDPNQNRPR